MAQRCRLEPVSSGFRALLRSAEMQDLTKSIASRIQQKAGDGYEMNTLLGVNRATARVYTADKKAFRDNNNNNTLLKSLR